MKTSHLTMLFAGVLLFAGFSCTDAKEKACEKAYSQINKCLPGYGSKKKMQIRLCRKTFEKSYTQGTVNCAKVFSSCDQFKECLEFSAKVGVFAQDKLARTSEVNEKCKTFEKREFKKCVKCVLEDKTDEQLVSCVKGEDEPQKQNSNSPSPVAEKDKASTSKTPTPVTKDSTETGTE
ncbi:MAG: hypothetical protein PF689_09560 [Deltaproteobacteria bacterium]|jgi:hypothetical protein|nr:hypothetical protein [Deltaproteobacteria bacterium]